MLDDIPELGKLATLNDDTWDEVNVNVEVRVPTRERTVI
jgi:hypothetical protein